MDHCGRLKINYKILQRNCVKIFFFLLKFRIQEMAPNSISEAGPSGCVVQTKKAEGKRNI